MTLPVVTTKDPLKWAELWGVPFCGDVDKFSAGSVPSANPPDAEAVLARSASRPRGHSQDNNGQKGR